MSLITLITSLITLITSLTTLVTPHLLRHVLSQVILSTSIAETALTVDDVMFVIDSGRIEERVYDPRAGYLLYNYINN